MPEVYAGIVSGFFDEQLVRDLLDIYPAGAAGKGFHLRLPVDDPVTVRVLARLEASGRRPKIGLGRQDRRTEFRMALDRVYAAAELAEAPLLRIAPEGRIFEADDEVRGRVVDYLPGRTITIDQGLLTLEPRFIRRPEVQDRLNGGDGGGPIVSDSVRRRLEGCGLVGLAFRPTVLARTEETPDGEVSEDLEWGGEHGPPWWEIASDVVLPPLSSSVELWSVKGERVEPGRDDVAYIAKEGLYRKPELRYLRPDLEAAPPFDLAATRERFDCLRDESRWLICSQRFYRCCIEQGIETEWVPVRLD